jgi:hypothetical protein
LDYYESVKRFQLLMEDIDKPYFPVETVYQTYYALWLGQRHGGDSDVEYTLEAVAKSLREEYLEAYMDVVKAQLMKYYKRQRVDQDFDAKQIKSNKFKVLDDLMNKTYRSDMRRRNDRWNMLTEYLTKLQDKKMNYMDMLLTMDRINNVVHNTGEVMLTKFDNARELLQAFEKSHNIKDPKEFKQLGASVTLNKLARTLGEEEE